MVCLGDHIPRNFLKGVFHKIHLVYSRILCLIWSLETIGGNPLSRNYFVSIIDLSHHNGKYVRKRVSEKPYSRILCCGLFPDEGFIIIVDLLGNFFKFYLVFLIKAKFANALFSSRFKKNLVDFSQYLYQCHFLQTLIPVVITSSSFSQALYYWFFF